MPSPARTAADLGRPAVTRRNVLAAGSLLGLAAAPALAAVEPEDPILPIYRCWCAVRAERMIAIHDAECAGIDVCQAVEDLSDREFAAFDELRELRPTSLAGIAAHAHALWVYGGPCSLEGTADWHEECRSWENELILAIWRAASGRDGFPREGRS
ncbi:hypothetical protein CNY89_03150 [Amaricoccus sp. HAR-UPW-R2A-40]|nr:hypothetical protein CNY89_03150 [Amaricoccus sp. HAR-UPW-R2A-40]